MNKEHSEHQTKHSDDEVAMTEALADAQNEMSKRYLNTTAATWLRPPNEWSLALQVPKNEVLISINLTNWHFKFNKVK